MTESTEIQILSKIKKAKRGSLFFVKDFLRIGNSKTITKALERLVKKEEIARVAKAIAKRDKARIIPTGAMALNALGLSTQVPMNVVYLTDGAARRINIGKRKIIFKKTSPKNLSAIGKIS